MVAMETSGGNAPFTEYVTKSQRAPGNAKPGWIAAGFLAVLLIAVALLWLRSFNSLRSSLDDANASLAAALAENKQSKDQIAALQTQVTNLENEKEMVGQRAKGLEDEMRCRP